MSSSLLLEQFELRSWPLLDPPEMVEGGTYWSKKTLSPPPPLPGARTSGVYPSDLLRPFDALGGRCWRGAWGGNTVCPPFEDPDDDKTSPESGEVQLIRSCKNILGHSLNSE